MRRAQGRQADATRELLKARVGPERIESRPQQNARVKSLFVSSLQPIHRLISIAKSRVDHGDLRSKRSDRARPFLQITEQFFRSALLAECGVGASKICYARRAISRELDRSFEFC